MKTNKLIVIQFVIFLLTLVAPKVRACDLCSVYLARGIQGQSTQGFYGGASEQFSHFSTLRLNGWEVPNTVNQYLDSSTTQVYLGYNFFEGFGLQVNLPIITRHYQRPHEFMMDKGEVSGIGDLSAHLNWTITHQFPSDVHMSLKLHGGIKFPTGSSKRISEELAEHMDSMSAADSTMTDTGPTPPESGIHGHDLALGSGSYDGILGADFYVGWKRVFLSGGVQYAARSRGSYDYRYGDDFNWNAGPGVYLVMNHSASLAVQALATGERKGLDDLNGTPAEDTGISSVYLGPQAVFTLSKWLAIDAGADLPIVQNNTSLQLLPDYRVHFGATIFFPSFKS